jgi:hypothetical protein
METDLNNAIAEVISKHEERGLVTKWIALIETLDAEGARGMWTATSDGLTAWDTDGMLHHALNLQKAETLGFVLGLFGDDDE